MKGLRSTECGKPPGLRTQRQRLSEGKFPKSDYQFLLGPVKPVAATVRDAWGPRLFPAELERPGDTYRHRGAGISEAEVLAAYGYVSRAEAVEVAKEAFRSRKRDLLLQEEREDAEGSAAEALPSTGESDDEAEDAAAGLDWAAVEEAWDRSLSASL